MSNSSKKNDNGPKAVTIVLDGVGVGAQPDSHLYGDGSANSLAHAALEAGGLDLPVLGGMGLGNIIPVDGVRPEERPTASWGKMMERSPGKDSISGHWELMGLPLTEPFPTYPDGFPPGLIAEFERKTGKKILGNRPASGTEIIEELGEEHLRTGKLIVYTSADSVFQIAAHDDIIDAQELYDICRTAREILVHPHNVGRVIARPFIGKPGGFERTSGRHDFALPPSGKTLLDHLSEGGRPVVTVGKIHYLFAMSGIDVFVETYDNEGTMSRAEDLVRGGEKFSFLFINLIDFDMLWGHRRDFKAYVRGLESFDAWLGGFVDMLEPGTFLAVTADHGCDPTAGGSDHTREYVPVLAKLVGGGVGKPLGTRTSFCDLAATLAEFFRIDFRPGESFLGSLA